MPTTEVTIDGIHSDDDLRCVMNAIQDLPCIHYADVDRDSGKAEVEHTTMVSEGDIRAAVEDAGFATR
jgi:copper chaperone CopZ